MPVPERYDLSYHLVAKPRSAHAARCSASIHLRLHNHCNIPVPYLLKRVINVQRGYLRNQRRTKRRAFIVDKVLGFLAISESEGTKRGITSNGHVIYLTSTHYTLCVRISVGPKGTEKQSGRVGSWIVDRGDDRMSGNCVVVSSCTSRVLFWTPSPMSSSSIHPGLLNPSLACSRALRSITSSSREAALRACCALLSFDSSSSSLPLVSQAPAVTTAVLSFTFASVYKRR